MTPKNLDSSTTKIARSLLGTRMRGARLFLRDLSGLEDTSRRIAVGNGTVKVTSVPLSPARRTHRTMRGDWFLTYRIVSSVLTIPKHWRSCGDEATDFFSIADRIAFRRSRVPGGQKLGRGEWLAREGDRATDIRGRPAT